MRSLPVYLIIGLLFTSGNCKEVTNPMFPWVSPPHRPRFPMPPTIIGSWNWIESETMFGIVTPVSERFTITLRFDRDSNFYYYKNDTLLIIRKYWIFRDYTPGLISDTSTILEFENPGGRSDTKQIVEFFGTDTLKLTDTGLDAGYSRYVRNH